MSAFAEPVSLGHLLQWEHRIQMHVELAGITQASDLGELDGQMTHTAGSPRNKHGLARSQASPVTPVPRATTSPARSQPRIQGRRKATRERRLSAHRKSEASAQGP